MGLKKEPFESLEEKEGGCQIKPAANQLPWPGFGTQAADPKPPRVPRPGLLVKDLLFVPILSPSGHLPISLATRAPTQLKTDFSLSQWMRAQLKKSNEINGK